MNLTPEQLLALRERAVVEWREDNGRSIDWECEDYIDPSGVRRLIDRFIKSMKSLASGDGNE